MGSPSLEDVFHEDAIQAGGKTLAHDAAFCVSGRHRFYLEVKKPVVSLKGDFGHALYGPVAIRKTKGGAAECMFGQ